MIEGRRRPSLAQRAFRHQALTAQRVPERAADCAGIGTAVKNRADDFRFARAGVAMLADIAVKAKGAVVSPLDQAFALQKVDRQDSSMPAVAAAERQRAASEIRNGIDRPPAHSDDLGGPAEIRVAHGNRPAAMLAPRI